YPAQQLEHEGEYQSLHWQARDEDAAQVGATISKRQSRAGAGRPARLLYLRTEPLYAAFFFGCAANTSTPVALAIASALRFGLRGILRMSIRREDGCHPERTKATSRFIQRTRWNPRAIDTALRRFCAQSQSGPLIIRAQAGDQEVVILWVAVESQKSNGLSAGASRSCGCDLSDSWQCFEFMRRGQQKYRRFKPGRVGRKLRVRRPAVSPTPRQSNRPASFEGTEEVNAAGVISTIAGHQTLSTSIGGYRGDGGAATWAELFQLISARRVTHSVRASSSCFPPSSPRSQSLARDRSRLTVPGETPSATAISFRVRPPKKCNSITWLCLRLMAASLSNAASRSTRSGLRSEKTFAASSSVTCGAPPPRFRDFCSMA